MQPKILITGATGHFGRATIDRLLAKGVAPANIIALVRDEAKAAGLAEKGIQLRQADYNNYDSLVEAFKGIDKLLFVSSSDLQGREEQQENVVRAAKAAKVPHIIYTSYYRRTTTPSSAIHFVGKSHQATENSIKTSGLTYTIMLNSLYTEVLPLFMGEQVLQTGIYLPAGEGKASFTSRLDMAEAAANILTGTGHENKEYTITNNTNYSLQDVAETLSEVSGKTISYLHPSAAEYTETLTHSGVPPEYIGLFVGFSTAIADGEFTSSGTDLETLISRKPTTLKETLQSIYSNSNN